MFVKGDPDVDFGDVAAWELHYGGVALIGVVGSY